MRKLFLIIVLTFFSCSFLANIAHAKRFGGGKSFGMSRQASSFNRGYSSSRPFSQPLNKPASTAQKWLGPLAGLALGGLLASLFMGHGVGSGILSWIMLAAGAFLVWRLLSGLIQAKSQPAVQSMNYQPASNTSYSSDKPFFSSNSSSINEVPKDFDQAAFLRQAKALFIRLQTAYDSKNLQDIREFTSPEVFAEIQLQLQERGDKANVTEIIHIDAESLDVTHESAETIASVLFSGTLREEQGADPVSIKEIWHLTKRDYDNNWIVAGIQQQ